MWKYLYVKAIQIPCTPCLAVSGKMDQTCFKPTSSVLVGAVFWPIAFPFPNFDESENIINKNILLCCEIIMETKSLPVISKDYININF